MTTSAIFVLLLAIGAAWSAAITESPKMEATTTISESMCDWGQVYHKMTEKCYAVGEQGPCGNNSFILPDLHGVGMCLCLEFPINGTHCGYRPAVLWPEDMGCYPLYDRGPCSEGEWLVQTADRAKCEQNMCLDFVKEIKSEEGDIPSSFIFAQDGKCYEVGTQAYCKEGEIALYGSGYNETHCYDQEVGACMTYGSITFTGLNTTGGATRDADSEDNPTSPS